MKKQTLLLKHHYLLPLMLLAFIKPVTAQDILWEKSYGGKHADYLFDVQPTADYGFILAGSSLSKKTGNKTDDNRGDLDYWVWKMDDKGDFDWQRSFGGNGQDKLRCVLLTNDGGYLLAGSSESGEGMDKKDKGRGEADFWVIKLNATGGEEWQKTIGGSGQDELTSIVKTKDGGFVLGGSSSSEISGEKTQDNFGGMDYWVVKIDGKGKIEWQNTFGGIYKDELQSIAITKDNGFIIGGSSNSPESGNKTEKNLGFNDYWILKLDEKGELQWQKNIGGKGDDQLFVVHSTLDGGFVLGGNSNSETGEDKRNSNQSGTDFWILKLDAIATILWQETYNIGKVDVLTSLVENDDKTILLGGYAQGIVAKKKGSKVKKALGAKPQKTEETMKNGTADYVAIKINDKGEEKWRKSVGSEGEDILKKVIETRDGGYLLAGTSKGKISKDRNTSKGSNDFWVVKLLDKKKPKEDKKPIEAFPNPTTQYTNVIVNLEFAKGTATVYDLAGRQLQSFSISDKTIPIDLGNAPAGIYIVEIVTDKEKGSVKIIKGLKN